MKAIEMEWEGRNNMDFDKIFNGQALTLEQFNEAVKDMKLADLATGEYVAKGKYDSDIRKAQGELEKAKTTIANLEKAGDDSEALKNELEEYKKAEAERKRSEAAAEKERVINERFTAVVGDSKFSSEYAKDGVYSAFVKAINDPANVGKGDAQLFESLTKDKNGIFENPHKVNMGGFYNKGKQDTGLTKEKIMEIKDRAERRAAIAANMELFE